MGGFGGEGLGLGGLGTCMRGRGGLLRARAYLRGQGHRPEGLRRGLTDSGACDPS